MKKQKYPIRFNPKLILMGVLLTSTFQFNNLHAQCGYVTGLGCANTDYTNFGLTSSTINNPTTIEYDNYVSGYHSTLVRTFNGEFQTWGAFTGYKGNTSSTDGHITTPQIINAANYPGLTGTPLKATMASAGSGGPAQSLLLTTTGLFAWGVQGTLLDGSVTSSTEFQKLQARSGSRGIDNANTYALPIGVLPTDVKMMFATTQTLAIVTCDGKGYVVSRENNNRANGATGNNYTWYQVQTASSTPLTNIIAIRGSYRGMIAFTKDNAGVEKLYTWGTNTYLGNNSSAANKTYATEMTNPQPTGNIKMIGGTNGSSNNYNSFYVLYTNGNLYALGKNNDRQLGDWTTTDRTSWVQPTYTSNSGPVITNIAWISPNEHDNGGYPTLNALTNDGELVNWGRNSFSMLGRGSSSNVDPNNTSNPPGGLLTTDIINSVESGGHTTLITKKCEDKFGYAGHSTAGSAGHNTSATFDNFDFHVSVQICGATTTPTISLIGTPTTGPEGKMCNNIPVNLKGTPSGGVFSIVEGGATLTSGNTLTFTGTSGTVKIKYTVETECGDESSVSRSFELENCVLIDIKGTVWHDINSDAIKDGLPESGTNADVPSVSEGPIWVNLIDSDGIVVNSQQVNSDGTYSFSTAVLGTYEIWLSNAEAGVGVATSLLPTTFFELPGEWEHTGTNVDNTPDLSNKTGKITNVTISSASGNSNNNNFGIKNNTLILPVKIAYFTGNLVGRGVVLNWRTAAEQNNMGFEIEYNTNGKEWKQIGFVTSKAPNGNHSGNLNYEFKHDNPIQGSNYYRLKQIDKDGKYEYSMIKVVYVVGSKSEIQLIPNPVLNSLKIVGLGRNSQIEIYNSMGQPIFVDHTSDRAIKTVDMSGFNSGTYLVKIINEQGEVNVQKIIKR